MQHPGSPAHNWGYAGLALRCDPRAGMRCVIPFALLVGTMVVGYSPFRASFLGLIALLIGCFLFEWRDLKGYVGRILKSQEEGALAVRSIAAAGIVAGVLSMTVLAPKSPG